MASLKDLKNRIGSVKSTQKITKAMKMVAASKLRRAQEAAEAARPYAERMEGVIASLGASVAGNDGASPLIAGTGSDQRHLLVVATSERGLCGGFNTSIVREAKAKIRRLIAEGKDVKILCIGVKGYAQLKSLYGDKIIELVDLGHVKRLQFSDVSPIGEKILAMYENDEFDVCSLFFARFQSVLTQIVTEHQLIPVSIPVVEKNADAGSANAAYEYEPTEEEILNALLPRNVLIQLFRGLLENAASEQGSRMSAMDSATNNAGDMISSLTIIYNRTRQAVITKELIEIISGAEAL
jgi:F-type H+-transporting ATPase subunit gamma